MPSIGKNAQLGSHKLCPLLVQMPLRFIQQHRAGILCCRHTHQLQRQKHALLLPTRQMLRQRPQKLADHPMLYRLPRIHISVAAVENGPLWATQFHPEKSGEMGLKLLENWVGSL